MWLGVSERDLKLPLTLDGEDDPLADGGRDAVLGDAEVRAHLSPRDADQVQNLAVHLPPL